MSCFYFQICITNCQEQKDTIKKNHIQKLENIRRQVGGAMGKGFLCAINYQYPSDVVVERIKNGSLSLVTGEKPLRMLPNRYDMIKSRQCYQDERDFD
jgi:acetylornithine/succinyldiaminopimelate/putrescine aminotransferase